MVGILNDRTPPERVETAPRTCYIECMTKPHRIPESRFSPEEEAKLDALRRAIEEGARELEAGLGLEGEAVMAELQARFGTTSDEA